MSVDIIEVTQQEFIARQKPARHVRTEDNVFLIFENGSSIQIYDPFRGQNCAAQMSEPPIDDADELSLKTRLRFYTIAFKREAQAFLAFKTDFENHVRLRAKTSGGLHASMPAPDPSAVDQLKAGQARCDALKASIEDLEAKLAALPAAVEKRRLAEETKANIRAEQAEAEKLYEAGMGVRITIPESMKNPSASQSSSV